MALLLLGVAGVAMWTLLPMMQLAECCLLRSVAPEPLLQTPSGCLMCQQSSEASCLLQASPAQLQLEGGQQQQLQQLQLQLQQEGAHQMRP